MYTFKMTERRLSKLPGYQPVASVDPLDQYLREKSAVLGDESATHASEIIAAVGRMVIPPDKIESLAQQGRELHRRKYNVAPYVAGLVSRLITVAGRHTIYTAPTEQTALTTLFRDRYGVDLAPYMEEPTSTFAISGTTGEGNAHTARLNYMTTRTGRGGNIFWQLIMDGGYEYANMYCVSHDFDGMPLMGEGNISLIPGVEEALTADVAFLEETQARRSH